jgi:heat-inducible transcriptional repressor
MLSYRGRRLLFALISEYLATGEPVSSSALVRGHEIELSSASVRAVLAELEAQGYLLKPHTSAGRVPTEAGLRAFVDALLASHELPGEALAAIERRFRDVEPGLEPTLRHAGKVLAEVTGSAAVIVAEPGHAWVLHELRFIGLRPGEVLAVIVGSNGAVQNRILRTDEPLSPAELDRVNNLLQSILGGRSLAQVRQLLAEQLDQERGDFDPSTRLALSLGQRALAQVERGAAEVFVEGQAQLIGLPDFADIERARQVLRTLEDKARLVELLDRTLAAPGIQVLIGSEDAAMGAGELSLVATQFGSGSLGVIGATRMDYPSVVPIVRHTARLLSRLLREPRDDDPSDEA